MWTSISMGSDHDMWNFRGQMQNECLLEPGLGEGAITVRTASAIDVRARVIVM